MDTISPTTLATLFTAIFDRNHILELARQFKATQRMRDIHPADMLRSLVESALGDEKRTISSARRRFGRISGFSPEEKAFYERFNRGLVRLTDHMLRTAVETCPASSRILLARLLDHAGLADMLAIDGSRFALPSWAKEKFPSTDDNHGGVKLTAMMSLLNPIIEKVIITDARQHDRKAVRLPRWLHGLLLLMDRGYCDRKLFAQIEDRKGFFLIRFKKNFRPRITCIRSGLDLSYLDESFRSDLPFTGDVDVDVAFKMPDGGERNFRLVRFVVGFQKVGNREEPVDVLFVTNLSAEQFTVEQLATLYRFRWEVEKLFAIAKGVCRLDHLRSGNKNVVETFVYASLLAVVLGLRVCAWMRQQRPRCEPSAWRVTTLVLEWLPEIAGTVGRSESWLTFNAFEAALWREGVNPNPGRKYTATKYTFELGWQQACRGPSCATV